MTATRKAPSFDTKRVKRATPLGDPIRATLVTKHYDPWEGSCTPDAIPGQPPLMADAISILLHTAPFAPFTKNRDRQLAEPGIMIELDYTMGDPERVSLEIMSRSTATTCAPFYAQGILPLGYLETMIELLREVQRQADKVKWDPRPVEPGLK